MNHTLMPDRGASTLLAGVWLVLCLAAAWIIGAGCVANRPITPVTVTQQATEIVRLVGVVQQITIDAEAAGVMSTADAARVLTTIRTTLVEAGMLPAAVTAWNNATVAAQAQELRQVRRILFIIGEVITRAEIPGLPADVALAITAVLGSVSTYLVLLGGL